MPRRSTGASSTRRLTMPMRCTSWACCSTSAGAAQQALGLIRRSIAQNADDGRLAQQPRQRAAGNRAGRRGRGRLRAGRAPGARARRHPQQPRRAAARAGPARGSRGGLPARHRARSEVRRRAHQSRPAASRRWGAARKRWPPSAKPWCSSPAMCKARHALGMAYHMLGRIEEAAQVYRDWLKDEPGNPEALHHLAACSGEGVPDRAAGCLRGEGVRRLCQQLRCEAGACSTTARRS